MSLLQVENLRVSFRHSQNTVVDGISFSINKGEILGIVGESGSGKSVTAQSIMRLLPDTTVHYPSGSITLEGQELLALSQPAMRSLRGHQVAMIFQEPMSALNPLHTISKQLEEAISLHQKLPKNKLKERVLELLDEVELTHMHARLDAYPHQLSGGERQRIMIAMALANTPQLLIADEPTTALDVHVQEQIITLLLDLRKRHNMAILFISHDLHLIRRIADRTLVMQHGKIVEHGNSHRIFEDPQHPYTQKLLAAQPSGHAIPVSERSTVLLDVVQVNVAFSLARDWLGRITHSKQALEAISFTLRTGHTLGVVGESGSGKSTLAQAILRLIPYGGEILFYNKNLATLAAKELQHTRKDIQIVFQDPFASLNPRFTVGMIIREGLDLHFAHLSEEEKLSKQTQIMRDVGLDPQMALRYPHEFSGGQRQRISIARAMILQPKLLILDEPTSALDVSLQAQILQLLKDLQAKYGTSYIFITHDLRVIRSIAHEILVLQQGKIVEYGTTEAIFTASAHPYTQQLIRAAFASA